MTDQDNSPETKPDEPAPMPPGRGSPIVPGPPMSVQPPIPARTFNLAALAWLVVAVVLAIVVLLIGVAMLRPR